MLMSEYEKVESTNTLKKISFYIILIFCAVFFQQSYARTHQYGIEQPVGLLGIGEHYFRHPESFVGLHFHYPVSQR